MANDGNPNIRTRQSIRPSGRTTNRTETNQQNNTTNTMEPSTRLPVRNTSTAPTTRNTSTSKSVPQIKHSEKASEAEKLLESNSSLVRLQNNLSLLDVFINNKHMEMLSPVTGAQVTYTNQVQPLDASLKDMSGICVYCIDKVMLNPDESTY